MLNESPGTFFIITIFFPNKTKTNYFFCCFLVVEIMFNKIAKFATL